MNRTLLGLSSLLALTALIPTAALARVPDDSRANAIVECREARYPIGMPLTGKDLAEKGNPGDVATIDRIRYTPRSRTVGFLYTTVDRRVFVTDRPTAELELVDLSVMNQVVQAMGFVHENAFDPRDNGFVYYKVRWNSRLVKTMQLALARCPSSM